MTTKTNPLDFELNGQPVIRTQNELDTVLDKSVFDSTRAFAESSTINDGRKSEFLHDLGFMDSLQVFDSMNLAVTIRLHNNCLPQTIVEQLKGWKKAEHLQVLVTSLPEKKTVGFYNQTDAEGYQVFYDDDGVAIKNNKDSGLPESEGEILIFHLDGNERAKPEASGNTLRDQVNDLTQNNEDFAEDIVQLNDDITDLKADAKLSEQRHSNDLDRGHERHEAAISALRNELDWSKLSASALFDKIKTLDSYSELSTLVVADTLIPVTSVSGDNTTKLLEVNG